MRHSALILFLAAASVAATAQTPAKPAAPASTAPHTAAASSAIKLPPGVPPARGIVRSAFTLRYQDIKIGTGAVAESNKLYKVHYTGWRAADGVKFDSSYDHPGPPVMDKDNKPVMGDDGKPKHGDPQPMAFPQGMGRLIPGFDQGFAGMKVGGKRRLFIPWQLAYGTRDMPARGADHPGIPPKSDLIFDVELVDVSDMPAAPNRPGMGGMPGGRPMPPGGAPRPGAPPAPGATPAPPAPGAPATPPAPGANPAPDATPAPSAAPAPSTAPAPQSAPAVPTPTPPAPATPAPQASPAAPPPTTPAPSTPAPATPTAPTQPQSH
jgi:peptidylprolyl isomerase